MKFLSPPQHFDDRLYPFYSGFRLFRSLEPISDRVEISFVERFKESSRLLVFGKLLYEVIRHARVAERILGSLPAAVGLCGLNLFQSGGSHLSRLDETLRMLGVDLRPFTVGPSPCELLKP
jgi:hypothetical protein